MSGLNWEADFAHLHVASSYSLRYGAASPAALATRTAELGMSALALTDRDGLYGAVKHAVACAEAGIAPILGADMALRDGERAGADGGVPLGPSRPLGRARRPGPPGPARLRTQDAPRVTLLAVGGRGWASLTRLVSAAHQAGERGAPVVTPGMIADHAEGLIVLLGPASDVGRAIAARRPDLAAAALERWRRLAEPVVEIVDHRAAADTSRATRMFRLAQEAGVPAVLTNAVRYLDPADSHVAQVLDSARQMVPLARQRPERLATRAHLASGAEMARIAARVCGASDLARLLGGTVDLARRCSLEPGRDLGIGGRFLPETVGDSFALLRARCEEGLDRRFPRARSSPGTPAGSGVPGHSAARPSGRGRRDSARRRLDHELGIIAKTGLASYFLTVADVADSIRREGIRCSIRGSGAGSLVNYLLGISGIDPLEHDLIMERFLSEGREGLPDIDLDVESARRLDAYRVIFRDYGEQRVACVSMMETYRARSAIRDTGAALGLPPAEIDALAKAFPHIRAAHITGALAELPELRGAGLDTPLHAEVFRLAEKLDGLPRHVAMHPCGVVLSNASLLDRTPVERSIDGFPLSQFDKDDVETAGMIKLDVLGVRMQSAMAYTLTEIERTTGERIDIDAIARDDEPTFELIRSARTLGCFQIESPGQRELVGKLLPRDVGDLIVDISLFRPGPVNSDMVTPYLEIRHGRRPPAYPHRDLAGALRETGGVVIFHEQVLRVIDAMTGCGLSDAELARRHLAREESRQRVEEWFRRAARCRGYDEPAVDRVWEVLSAFGAFGFCKAHAAAFAIPTYQSAWLKRHYPAAFYAGVLTHDPGMYPKRVIVADARLLGVPVRGVDVNASAGHWRVERVERVGRPPRDALRAGLAEVKGISEAEVARIVAGQPYTSLRDFWERAGASRPVTENLVLVGAFDSLYRAGPGWADTGPGPGEAGHGPGEAGRGPAGRAGYAPGAAGHGPGSAGHAPGVAPGGMTSEAGSRRVSRRDLLARVGVLERSRTPARAARVSRAAHVTRPHVAQPRGTEPRGTEPRGTEPRGTEPRGTEPRLTADLVTTNHDKSDAEVTEIHGKSAEYAARPPEYAARPPAEDRQLQLDMGAGGGDGFAGLVPAGELRELTPAERVEAELEILGIDLSQHVLTFYEDLITELGVVRSADLRRCEAGARVLVAGVKVATQTPAIRSGQRIIFATLDDATGPVDLAFFESVQDRCAARVFGSWLLVVRGRLRRAGRSVSVNATECWDLAALAQVRATGGIRAVRAAMAAGDVPGAGGAATGAGAAVGANPKIIYPNGFTLSPYAETGAPGSTVKDPPRRLWHASPGSSGGWAAGAG